MYIATSFVPGHAAMATTDYVTIWLLHVCLALHCHDKFYISIISREHEIQFYEMQNFEPYCQLRKLEAVPLKLDFWLVQWSIAG